MTHAYIVTPWHGSASDGFRPLFAVAYPGASWEDVTGQQPPALPDAYTIRATLDDATLSLVEADARFTVLSSEPIPDDHAHP